MYYRHISFLIVILLCYISVSRASLLPPEDQSLLLAAERLSEQNYTAARVAALQARPGPTKDFVLGVTAYHLEKWDETERYLATSPDCFPLLGDVALSYRATALVKLSRPAEALVHLERLRKAYPDSPYARSASLRTADILFQQERFREALTAYQGFRSAYPSGNDSLKALLHAALCREKLGDVDEAIFQLREIWLDYPAKPIARQAEAELERLRNTSTTIPPYTSAELFKRACLLFDQQHYRDAAIAFSSLSLNDLSEKHRGQIAFNTAMTQYRLKKNTEAIESFTQLASAESPYPEYALEASYRLGHLLDRTGKNDEAVALFLKLAKDHPESPLADNALFYAALIRKHDGAHQEALVLFQKILNDYPASSHAPRSLWETAWSHYLSGDFPKAATTFSLLANDGAWREKALYWQARALEASGDRNGARSLYAVVQKEFPTGFYALYLEKETGNSGMPIPAINDFVAGSLPEPRGLERAQALISLGLLAEARTELAATKKRNGKAFRGSLAHAGLYLAMNDYRSAMALFRSEDLQDEGKNNPFLWTILYPAAFKEIVTRHTANMSIDESLTFALIRAESNFLPTARSPVGALGLMQLMPATAKATAQGMGAPVSEHHLTKPEINIKLGTRYLRDLITRFNGNLVSAVAAYNAGSTPVRRWRKNFPTLREDEFIENIPYAETREYVKKVLAAAEIYRRLYGLKDSSTGQPTSSPEQTITTSAQSRQPVSSSN